MSTSLRSRIFTSLKLRKKIILGCLGAVLAYGVVLGVLAPKIIVAQAQKIVQQRLGLTLDVEHFRVNPFVFTAEIENLVLGEKGSTPLLGFERFFIDFETSSLFRWAWTLNHFELTGLVGNFERYTAEDNTLFRLQHKWLSSALSGANEQSVQALAEDNGASSSGAPVLPRFLVRDIHFQIAALTIVDNVPVTDFRNTIGPVDIGIDELTSLPDQIGQHHISIKSDRGIDIAWQGDIDLASFKSQGKITVKGPYPVIASDYLQDSLPVIIQSGYFTSSFNYLVESQADSTKPISLFLSEINASLDDLAINEKATSKPLFTMKKVSLSDASLRWPEQIVMLPHVAMVEGQAWLQRDREGITNVERILAATQDGAVDVAEHDTESAVPQTSNASALASNLAAPTPWTVKNTLFEVNNWTLHWRDQAIDSSPQYDISKLSLAVHNFQLKEHEPVSIEYGLSLLGGDITGEGSFVPVPFGGLKINAKIQHLLLPPLQPYVASVAKVFVKEGRFDGDVLVESVDDDFAIESSFAVSELRVLKGANGSEAEPQDILRWQKLTFDDVNTTAKGNAVSINQILLNAPFADFAIAQDGTTTIDEVLITQLSSSNPPTIPQDEIEVEGDKVDSQAEKYHVKIGSINVVDGAGYFADASLPLPFATKIHHLNGGVTTLDSRSQAASDLKLEGQLDEYGLLTADGSLSLLAFDQQSDLTLNFKNVNVPNFTPYAVKFAGRKITDGRLDLNLKYAFDQGRMRGDNRIVLRSFNFGEAVEQPGAMDLPLDLAVALLKDGKGQITMDIPIEGDVNSPEFSVSRIAGQALVKILKSAVTSPFRLLAGIVGGNADNFGQVLFSAGRADITPPEKEKLASLAKAMLARPELALSVSGIFDKRLDVDVLQLQQFDAQVIEALGESLENLSLTSKATLKYLTSSYELAQLSPVLSQLQLQFMTEGDKGSLDQLAYAKAIIQHLVEREVVPENAVIALANRRANNVKQTLLALGVEEGRLTIGKPVKLNAKVGSDLILKLDVKVAP